MSLNLYSLDGLDYEEVEPQLEAYIDEQSTTTTKLKGLGHAAKPKSPRRKNK